MRFHINIRSLYYSVVLRKGKRKEKKVQERTGKDKKEQDRNEGMGKDRKEWKMRERNRKERNER